MSHNIIAFTLEIIILLVAGWGIASGYEKTIVFLGPVISVSDLEF